MKLSPRQSEFLHPRTYWGRINILEGAVRSGKTVALHHIAPYLAQQYAGKGAIVAATLETLRENILNPMQAIFGHSVAYADAGRRISICGKTIRGVGANDERSARKITGDTLAWAIGDEAVLWPESFFKMLLSRLSEPRAKLFVSTNPAGPNHWLKKHFIDRADDIDIACHKFLLEQNPYLDPDYVSGLKREYTGVWYQRYILGEWALAEGRVYDMFDRAKHVKKMDRFGDLLIGVDYGTSNATAFLKIDTDETSGDLTGDRAHVFQEYYFDSREKGRQKTDSEYADDMLEFMGGDSGNLFAIIVDPSAASFILELKRRGLPVKPASNEVIQGIRTVSTMLGAGRLTIDPACERLIGETEGYVWDTKAQEMGLDKPIKLDDHAMDALRYPIHTRFGRRRR